MRAIVLVLALMALTPAFAQPADLPIAAATTDTFPKGVKILKLDGGSVYANKRGQVLYGMDMRTLLRWGPDPAHYCRETCAQEWEPLLAPSDAVANIKYPRGFDGSQSPIRPGFVRPQAAPDWTVIEAAAGRQWVYKGWHLVFARKGSKRGATEFEGANGKSWNTLKYVPQMPVLTAPSGVKPVFTNGTYALADKDGRLLYSGACRADCEGWTPYAAAAASAGLGEWTVNSAADTPQWQMRGQPVFVQSGDALPPEGKVLRP